MRWINFFDISGSIEVICNLPRSGIQHSHWCRFTRRLSWKQCTIKWHGAHEVIMFLTPLLLNNGLTQTILDWVPTRIHVAAFATTTESTPMFFAISILVHTLYIRVTVRTIHKIPTHFSMRGPLNSSSLAFHVTLDWSTHPPRLIQTMF